MKLIFYRLIAAAGLVAATKAATGSEHRVDDQRELAEHELCRCEASWENLYNRRLGEDPSEAQRERELYHHYDYTQAFKDGGYYVIEGVLVMPSHLCNSFNLFGGRNLEEDRVMSYFERDVLSVVAPKVDSPAMVLEEADSSIAETPKTRDLTYCKCRLTSEEEKLAHF